ncbi:MAG: hypothetical protein AB8H79_19605, partial [Myxococcota bacterium]
PDTQANACWNFALNGNVDGAVDPANGFNAAAQHQDSPYQTAAGMPPGMLMEPKPGLGGSADRQQAWHTDTASAAIAASGWELQPGSSMKIAYQWVPGTAQYHHWELWFEQDDRFVSIAKFPGQPVHAKNTQTDLEAEGLQQVEIGVDPSSIPDAHLARLAELQASPESVAASNIYG